MRGFALFAALWVLGGTAALAADEQPICPDRPSKSTGPCTVPVGQWQVETGLVDWTHDSSGGVQTDVVAWGNSAIKYGFSPRADVELWVTPLETMNVRGGGHHEHDSSIGDTLVRGKFLLTKDGSRVQVALDPYLKIPTANHQLGNGKIEGGLLLAVAVPIGKTPLTMSFDPELDLLADQDGHDRHPAMIQLINLGWQASPKLNLSTEIWGMWDWDPQAIGRQVSWDGSAAYLLTNDLQLDAGANFGLNKATAAIELYTGVSVRF